jgi:FixJ family two-component response regulator
LSNTDEFLAAEYRVIFMVIPSKIVAVIDDDLTVLVALRRLLSTCGYKAELYASSDAFLGAVSSSAASCLVVDIQLADGNGIELVQQLRATGFDFATIFMTGSDDQTVQKRAQGVGCVAFLRKPLIADLLLNALANVGEQT